MYEHRALLNSRTRRWTNSIVWILPCVGVLFAPYQVAGQSGEIPRDNVRQALTERILHPKDRFDRLGAFQKALTLKPESRNHILEELINLADEEYAVLAAETLIAEECWSELILATIATRLPSWSDDSEHRLLWAVQLVKDPRELLFIPRQILRSAAANANRESSQTDGVSSIDRAALLLNRTDITKEDFDLIWRAVKANERSVTAWLVLGGNGAKHAEIQARARAVYRDESYPAAVRVSAAGVLAHTDEVAAEFAASEIRAFLNEYSHQSIGQLFPGLYTEENRDARKAYTEFHSDIRVLTTLRFLPPELTKSIVFEFVESDNELIGEILGLVAVIRWPEAVLLQVAPESLAFDGQRLFAAIAHYHPKLTGAVAGKITQERLEVELKNVQRYRVHGVFGLAAAIANGW